MKRVHFHFTGVKPTIFSRKNILKQFILDVFLLEGKELKTIDFIFCTDEFLLGLNKTYLNHDYFTDILTFDISEQSDVIGEVYISVDRVRNNAVKYNCPFKKELLLVIFHGVLHLCGYKDKKKGEIVVMRQKEDYYLGVLEKQFPSCLE